MIPELKNLSESEIDLLKKIFLINQSILFKEGKSLL